MGVRQVSEPRFWSQKQLSTMQVSQKCNLGKVGFSCLLFSYLNCLTSMQTGQLRPYYISPLIKLWTQTSKNQHCCWSTGRANFFIAPWKPAYWQFTTFSFKTRNWNKIWTASCMHGSRCHAKKLVQMFLLNECAHQQYIQQSISLAQCQ